MSNLVWTKELSKTDAQQPTKGRLVPYLRLTKSSLQTEDNQTWFRFVYFDDQNWQIGSFGHENAIEFCHVNMRVAINRVNFGTHKIMITHGPNRKDMHDTPNTWLHWPEALQFFMQNNDFSGWPVTLERQSDGSFTIEIQAAKAES